VARQWLGSAGAGFCLNRRLAADDLVLVAGETSWRNGSYVSGSKARGPRVDLQLPLADLRQHQEITGDTAALKAAIVAVIAVLPEWQRAAIISRLDAFADGADNNNAKSCMMGVEAAHQTHALKRLVALVKGSIAALRP
jgi:hypothetical protein